MGSGPSFGEIDNPGKQNEYAHKCRIVSLGGSTRYFIEILLEG